MRVLAIVAVALSLTGCATGCQHSCILGFGPGNPMFNRVADHYDRTDPCQTREFSSLTGERLKPAGYTYKDIPSWCGARAGGSRAQTIYIEDTRGRTIARIRGN